MPVSVNFAQSIITNLLLYSFGAETGWDYVFQLKTIKKKNLSKKRAGAPDGVCY